MYVDDDQVPEISKNDMILLIFFREGYNMVVRNHLLRDGIRALPPPPSPPPTDFRLVHVFSKSLSLQINHVWTFRNKSYPFMVHPLTASSQVVL